MIELDGDEERISSQGRYAERDIVQVCALTGRPEERAVVIHEAITPLQLRYAPVHFAIFLMTQSCKRSSPFPLCPFYPPLVCHCVFPNI